MIIGRFAESPVSGVLIGHIRTLFFKSDKVVFEPIAAIKNAKAPSHRIYTGDEVELGAAWRRVTPENGQAHFEVTLDDPTFATPVYARLEQEGRDRHGKGNRWFILIWNRAPKKKTAA